MAFGNRRIAHRSAEGACSQEGPGWTIAHLERAKGFEPSTPTLARLRSIVPRLSSGVRDVDLLQEFDFH